MIALAFFCYLLGSVPFGLILTRLAGLGDVRAIGSGNIGATNVLRTGNKGLAALTLFLDMAKAMVPIMLLADRPQDQAWLGLCVVLGHCFPVFLKFRGGKGVATSLGVVLALDLNSSLLALAVFIVTMAIWKYISLSSLLATTAFLVGHFTTTEKPLGRLEWGTSAIMIGLWAMMIWRHRANIKRIIAGTEPKVGQKKRHEKEA